jgi:hypothetical protein
VGGFFVTNLHPESDTIVTLVEPLVVRDLVLLVKHSTVHNQVVLAQFQVSSAAITPASRSSSE